MSRRRKLVLPAFAPHVFKPSINGSGIAVTIDQARNALLKLATRFNDWWTPLGVASCILDGLDDIRESAHKRSSIALVAMDRGDLERVRQELLEVQKLTELSNGKYGVRVTADPQWQAIKRPERTET